MNTDEIDKLVRSVENKLKRSFREMVRSIRDENSVGELAEKIARGDLGTLIEGVDVAVDKFATEISTGYVKAGQKAARWLNERVPSSVKFNITSDDAIGWMQDAQESITRSLLAEQQEVARSVVASGRARGLSDRAIAEEVQRSIGLNREQLKHVESYRDALTNGNYANAINRQLADARSARSLRAAAQGKQALTPEKIDALVRRYTDNWIRLRSETIGLTQAQGAVHAGVEEMFVQAIEAGDVDEEQIVRVWITRNDARVRHSHKTMHGQRRSFAAPFKSGKGNLLQYPGDPSAPASEVVHCRCLLKFIVKRRLRLP